MLRRVVVSVVVCLIMSACAGVVTAQTQDRTVRIITSWFSSGPDCLEETSSILDALQQNF